MKEPRLKKAVISGNACWVNFFLMQGDNVNAIDNRGVTYLMYVCIHDYIDIVELLIEKGANVNAVDNEGRTSLMHACSNDNTAIMEILVNDPIS